MLIIMKRVKVIVKGNIQKVGYRAKVIDIANNLGVKGEVENLKDGSVKIIAQGEEDNLKEFTKQVNIKNTLIRVDSVSVEPFATDEMYTDFKKVVKEKETDERLDTAAEHLKRLIEVTKYGIEENKKGFGSISKEIREGNERLTGTIKDGNKTLSGKLDLIHNDLSVNLKSFHHDTIARFDVVDKKYGKIAENIEKAVCAINRTCENTEKLLEKSDRDREDYKKSMKDLVGAIVKLAEKK